MTQVLQLLSIAAVTILLLQGCSCKPKVIVRDRLIEAPRYEFKLLDTNGSYIDLEANTLKNTRIVSGKLESTAKVPLVYAIDDNGSTVISAKGIQRICTPALLQLDSVRYDHYEFIVDQIDKYNETSK